MEIDTPIWWRENFDEEENEICLSCNIGIIDEAHQMTHREIHRETKGFQKIQLMIIANE